MGCFFTLYKTEIFIKKRGIIMFDKTLYGLVDFLNDTYIDLNITKIEEK